MKRFPFQLALILLLLGPAAVHAQKEAPKHTCRILFFNGAADAPEKLHLFDGVASREVDLPRLNFSEVYELPSGRLTLSLLPKPLKDPTLLPAGAPSAVVAEDVVDFYLLVTNDPENKVVPVRMQVIDAGASKIRAGQMLWFNISPNLVGGTVGSRKLTIQPGSRMVLDAPADGMQDYPVSLSFRIAGDEHTYSLCETRWRHNPRSRTVVFIYPEAGSRSPRVMGFSDYRERAPKDKER